MINKHDDSIAASYFFYAGSACLLVLAAALITLYIHPLAWGSGVAEVMAMLNGVNYKGCISLKALFVKFWGTLFAVTGGLCIGKEGPLVHMGAIVGVICCYTPLNGSRWMQNDVRKR